MQARHAIHVIGLALLAWIVFALAEPAAAQTPTPTITPTATITATGIITEWMFPSEGLQPYTYTQSTDNPLEGAIDRDDLWHMARVALTAYGLMDAKAWGLLALVILIPVALAMTYKIFTRPPEI